MDKSVVLAIITIVLSGVGYYLWQENEARLVLDGDQIIIPDEQAEVGVQTDIVEQIQYPVPKRNEPEIETKGVMVTPEPVAEGFALPALNDSDGVMQNLFGALYVPVQLAEIFIFTDFIRHLVVSVDNLTTRKLPRRFVFTQSPADNFMVSKSGEESEMFLDSANYERYRLFIDFSHRVDNQALVSIYIRYYPLFQEAFDELGYPGRYFNDRLIEVIDHLMQTPDIVGPIKLLQPKVYYQFADPELEELSAGRKILLRIGSENAMLIKRRLKDLRHILTTMKP